jgi:hypothetical protein
VDKVRIPIVVLLSLLVISLSLPASASYWDLRLLADGHDYDAQGAFGSDYSDSRDEGDYRWFPSLAGDSSLAIVKTQGLQGWTEPDTLLTIDCQSDNLPQSWTVSLSGPEQEHDLYFISDQTFVVSITNIKSEMFSFDWSSYPLIPGGMYGSISLPGGEAKYSFNVTAPVPEPGSLSVVIIGLAGFGGFVVRRKRS